MGFFRAFYKFSFVVFLEGGKDIIFEVTVFGDFKFEESSIDFVLVEEEVAEVIDNWFVFVDFEALEDVSVVADDSVGASVNVFFRGIDLFFFEIVGVFAAEVDDRNDIIDGFVFAEFFDDTNHFGRVVAAENARRIFGGASSDDVFLGASGGDESEFIAADFSDVGFFGFFEIATGADVRNFVFFKSVEHIEEGGFAVVIDVVVGEGNEVDTHFEVNFEAFRFGAESVSFVESFTASGDSKFGIGDH